MYEARHAVHLDNMLYVVLCVQSLLGYLQLLVSVHMAFAPRCETAASLEAAEE